MEMPTQIAFRKGEMQQFVATRSFTLGNTGMTLSKGQDFLFDGSTVDMGGDTFLMPQLRGAIKSGWIVPMEAFDEMDDSSERPRSAQISVHHPTKGGNPMRPEQQPKAVMATTESDEREVGSTSAHAQQARTRNAGYQRGQPINTDVELQDGVPVRALKTPSGEKSKQIRTVLGASGAGQAISEAESVRIEPGKGISESEWLENLSEGEREEYLAKKAALRTQYVDDEAPRVVGRVQNKKGSETREGIKAGVTTGGGVETADLSGLGTGKVAVRTVESEGMKFTTTNVPKDTEQPHPRAAEAPTMSPDVRRMVAKQVCPDFPDNYQFGLPPRKKLARLQADYEDRPDVIRAVFAAESDDFKAVLVQEFPEAFGG
jgi:hypothetical protein